LQEGFNVIDILAGAQQKCFAGAECLFISVVEHPLEMVNLRQLLKLRQAFRMTKEGLGACDYKRLAEVAFHLSTDQMEEIGRSCGIDKRKVCLLYVLVKVRLANFERFTLGIVA